MSQGKRAIAFIGGTGPEGLGLAMRFAHAGEPVIIGSRKQDRADDAAQKIKQTVPHADARGLDNKAAVQAGEIIFITVPFDGQASTLEDLKDVLSGKIVVDTVVPLKFEKGKISAVLVAEGSAAQQAARIIPAAKVVGAFQNLSAHELMDLEHPIPADVVVCGDDAAARKTVIELAGKIEGCRGIDGGGLANARYVEEITALLLNINKIYKTQSMIKIVGV